MCDQVLYKLPIDFIHKIPKVNNYSIDHNSYSGENFQKPTSALLGIYLYSCTYLGYLYNNLITFNVIKLKKTPTSRENDEIIWLDELIYKSCSKILNSRRMVPMVVTKCSVIFVQPLDDTRVAVITNCHITVPFVPENE